MKLKIVFDVIEVDGRDESQDSRHDTYEEAEKAVTKVIERLPADLLGSCPEYYIKKVWTAVKE